ncbi:hypothetical protein Taro_046197 [Colocasia esculenta]|uniref:Uncharacterized protein n=1 Tax=Colocasia esculenta TaxID=4460 RepID=A0A843WRM3_COLES|nr:hypothetical protein [Colocasia esculenta]
METHFLGDGIRRAVEARCSTLRAFYGFLRLPPLSRIGIAGMPEDRHGSRKEDGESWEEASNADGRRR